VASAGRFLCGKSHSEKPSGALRFHYAQDGLEQKLEEPIMTPNSDRNTLYVLACSTFGAIFSLAATWTLIAHSAQPLVA
jgi:hypothetical protein